MHAEDGHGRGHHPVFEGRLFQVRDAIEPGRDPVARFKHVAGNLRLDGVHIVHQRRRAQGANAEDQRGHQHDNQFVVAVTDVAGSFTAEGPHRLAQSIKVSRPHK